MEETFGRAQTQETAVGNNIRVTQHGAVLQNRK